MFIDVCACAISSALTDVSVWGLLYASTGMLALPATIAALSRMDNAFLMFFIRTLLFLSGGFPAPLQASLHSASDYPGLRPAPFDDSILTKEKCRPVSNILPLPALPCSNICHFLR